MPLTPEGRENRQSTAGKRRCKVRLEAHFPHGNVGANGEIRKLAGKCVIVMGQAVGDYEVRSVRPEGSSFGKEGSETGVLLARLAA